MSWSEIMQAVGYLVILVGACATTAILVWPLAWAAGRVRGELGPGLARCQIATCGNPSTEDSPYCTWHGATMAGAMRAKARRLGLHPNSAGQNRRRPPKGAA